jgi:hypothetical protein
MMGCGGGGLLARRRYERNWRAYERFRKDEAEPFLRKARAVVWSVEPPWVAKHGGRPAHDARELVLYAPLKMKMDYRSTSSYLKANSGLRAGRRLEQL